MAREIDILVVEPGKAPYPAKAKDTLETFQEIVGGPIEMGSYLPQRVMLICNGEGKNMGLPVNRVDPRGGDYIAGTFLLCSSEGDRFISLTHAQQLEFQSVFADPGEYIVVDNTVCTTRGEAALAVIKLWDSMRNGQSVVLTKWGGSPQGGVRA